VNMKIATGVSVVPQKGPRLAFFFHEKKVPSESGRRGSRVITRCCDSPRFRRRRFAALAERERKRRDNSSIQPPHRGMRNAECGMHSLYETRARAPLSLSPFLLQPLKDASAGTSPQGNTRRVGRYCYYYFPLFIPFITADAETQERLDQSSIARRAPLILPGTR